VSSLDARKRRKGQLVDAAVLRPNGHFARLPKSLFGKLWSYLGDAALGATMSTSRLFRGTAEDFMASLRHVEFVMPDPDDRFCEISVVTYTVFLFRSVSFFCSRSRRTVLASGVAFSFGTASGKGALRQRQHERA